ncbi:peptidoglycan/LPS O-acetylase OafA/YrhL [Paraburkholderia rhizosphaerae]|uniref:Peptidoglycan/LPS O-acetylase OafA/YrhL n=2 Tax=Paraburkholderia rhizosphaerae TaxID=480658 RepID=A0A4R8LMI2_9BURK|nr:acyltransferase [Paraburkholderia rhizosphaerae]TDY46515.1 peptidoglycan/LPS O-acetylase OafA/YrhL [Paraburkholderia rhizosphaerae]
MSRSNSQHYHQLDALRGVAALMVVISHFVLIGPLAWIPRSPLRVVALGHEAVILFFILSGFVLTLQLRSSRGISYKDFLIKRICRIYLPYLVVLVATFWIVDAIDVKPIRWAGDWADGVWSGPFTGTEIADHLLFIGRYKAGQMIPVIWSLIYELRISLVMPLVAYWVARVSGRAAVSAGIGISLLSFVLVLLEGDDPNSANFDGDWAMTLHYLGIFIVGAALAVHRAGWRQWLMKDGRMRMVLGASAVLYFVSRSVLSLTSGAVGQFLFDWFVTAGAAGLICTSLVSSTFTAVLEAKPIAFLGQISYSLYLTHTIVLLTVLHLMPSESSMWRTMLTAAALVIPVATLMHYVVERRTIMLGQFLTARRPSDAASRANQTY